MLKFFYRYLDVLKLFFIFKVKLEVHQWKQYNVCMVLPSFLIYFFPGSCEAPGQDSECADTAPFAENEPETSMAVFPPDTLYECLFWGRLESEWGPCRVARRRVQLSKARWSYLLTDDSCIVPSDSSVWEVLWIQSQMPPLLWYSCLDTKSTWTSIWSQHAALHVRQLLCQNCLLPHLLPPPPHLPFVSILSMLCLLSDWKL